MSDDAGVFRFTINVALHNESDPNRAIEWMVQHVFVGVQSGGLPIRGTAPDGTGYLWFPECGKTPDEYLANTFPPEATQ